MSHTPAAKLPPSCNGMLAHPTSHLAGLAGGPVRAVFIRAPWVEKAGADVEVLGRVVGGAADGRIVAVRQGNLVATSFHPELTGDRRVHALFVDIVRRRLAERASTSEEST